MKHLYLLRHAKSSWDDEDLDDFDRPLNQRGERAALVMGQFIAQEGLKLDRILSSGARRTEETIALVTSRTGEIPTERCRSLYLADPATILAEVQRLDPDVVSAMIVGHNPGLETFALALANDPRCETSLRVAEKFPTAALATFTLPVANWSDVRLASGRLDRFLTPKELV
ncbi:MAG: hypothetical protein CMM50_00435 [Rhodospirillaceae bacterium]|nr:hypothetical protein [Rhodospirillaceae bacterium]|tara:strand:- start:59 stop:571 length:513 start_codon:yes stop_codon:yes gene_type:complete